MGQFEAARRNQKLVRPERAFVWHSSGRRLGQQEDVVAVKTKRTVLSDGATARNWLADRMHDRSWVAQTKLLSDKADALLREKGLLPAK